MHKWYKLQYNKLLVCFKPDSPHTTILRIGTFPSKSTFTSFQQEHWQPQSHVRCRWDFWTGEATFNESAKECWSINCKCCSSGIEDIISMLHSANCCLFAFLHREPRQKNSQNVRFILQTIPAHTRTHTHYTFHTVVAHLIMKAKNWKKKLDKIDAKIIVKVSNLCTCTCVVQHICVLLLQ